MLFSKAICTRMTLWFGAIHQWLIHKSENAASDRSKFVILLLTFPCFKASHFFFKLAYTIDQHRLRFLCGEDFFLQFYDRKVATGGIDNIFQSLRDIKGGLDSAQASLDSAQASIYLPSSKVAFH